MSGFRAEMIIPVSPDRVHRDLPTLPEKEAQKPSMHFWILFQ